MRFHLFAAWSLCALPPAAIALLQREAYGSRRAALALLVAGLGLAAAGIIAARPGRQAVLRAGLACGPARVLIALAIALVTTLAVVVDAMAAWLLAGAGCAALLLLAAVAPTEAAFRRVTRLKLRILAACALLGAAGETLMRLPPVAHALAPPAYVNDQQRRHGRHYDAASFVPLGETTVRSRHLRGGALEPAEPGCRTVVVAGDSFTWGEHVFDTDAIWPYVAERILRERGLCVRMVNLAQGGYTTVNEVESVLRYGLPLQPDLIVLQYLVNDPLPSGPGFRRETGVWLLTPAPPLAVAAGLHRALDRHSYLYSWLQEVWRRLHAAWTRRPDRTFADLYAPGFSGWQDATAALRELAGAARARNIPVLAVITPVFTPELPSLARDAYLYTPQHELVVEAFAEQGIPCIDLLDAFAAENPDPRAWWVLPVDGHPSADAHRLIGRAVADEIARRLPARAAP